MENVATQESTTRTHVSTDLAEHFASALLKFENARNLESFLEIFSSQAPCARNQCLEESGAVTAKDFWAEYLAQFSEVKSHFKRKLNLQNFALLEWESQGQLAVDGSSFHYHGVSIVEYDGDKVAKFTTYFNAAELRTSKNLH